MAHVVCIIVIACIMLLISKTMCAGTGASWARTPLLYLARPTGRATSFPHQVIISFTYTYEWNRNLALVGLVRACVLKRNGRAREGAEAQRRSKLSHSMTRSLMRAVSHSLIHSLAHSHTTDSLTHSRHHSITQPLTLSLIHSLTHSLARSCTH